MPTSFSKSGRMPMRCTGSLSCAPAWGAASANALESANAARAARTIADLAERKCTIESNLDNKLKNLPSANAVTASTSRLPLPLLSSTLPSSQSLRAGSRTARLRLADQPLSWPPELQDPQALGPQDATANHSSASDRSRDPQGCARSPRF